MSNPYSTPEAYDLVKVYDINVGESYTFDMLVIWKKKDGSFVYDTDSGCSCPSPFENCSLETVKPAVPEAIREWFTSKFSAEGYSVGELEKALAVITPISKEEIKRADPWKTVAEFQKFLHDRFKDI